MIFFQRFNSNINQNEAQVKHKNDNRIMQYLTSDSENDDNFPTFKNITNTNISKQQNHEVQIAKGYKMIEIDQQHTHFQTVHHESQKSIKDVNQIQERSTLPQTLQKQVSQSSQEKDKRGSWKKPQAQPILDQKIEKQFEARNRQKSRAAVKTCNVVLFDVGIKQSVPEKQSHSNSQQILIVPEKVTSHRHHHSLDRDNVSDYMKLEQVNQSFQPFPSSVSSHHQRDYSRNSQQDKDAMRFSMDSDTLKKQIQKGQQSQHEHFKTHTRIQSNGTIMSNKGKQSVVNRSYEIEDQIEQMRIIQEVSQSQIWIKYSDKIKYIIQLQRFVRQQNNRKCNFKPIKVLKNKINALVSGHRVRKALKWLLKQELGKETLDLIRIKNDALQKNVVHNEYSFSQDHFLLSVEKSLKTKLQDFLIQFNIQQNNLKFGRKLEMPKLQDQLVLLNRKLSLRRAKSNERASSNHFISPFSTIQNNPVDQQQQQNFNTRASCVLSQATENYSVNLKNQLRVIFSRIENIILQHKEEGSHMLEDCIEDIKDIYKKEQVKERKSKIGSERKDLSLPRKL
eukprot:403341454